MKLKASDFSNILSLLLNPSIKYFKAFNITSLGKKLDEFRLKTMKEKNYGMTKLYNEFFSEPASKLSKLHKALDEAACKVYGWKYDSNKNYNQELFELNQELFAELTS